MCGLDRHAAKEKALKADRNPCVATHEKFVVFHTEVTVPPALFWSSDSPNPTR